ncbi:MAG: signal peptidase I [Bacteroidota bacterium]
MRLAFWKKPDQEQDLKTKKKKAVWREWADALVFAIVAATIIRTFFFEAYTIPTGSMEGSLLVNDYLFVSKMAYGPRVPMTPLAVPLVHNTMPLTGGKSYSEAVKWGYHRWWGFGNVERNDVVVFNFPAGDTVALEVQQEVDYYTLCRAQGRENVHSMYTIISRPIDKEENYIKRCIGVPGDKVEIKNGRVYINGAPNVLFPHSQTSYLVKTNGQAISSDVLEDNNIAEPKMEDGYYKFTLANDQVDLIKKQAGVTAVTPDVEAPGVVGRSPFEWVFPFDTANYKWNRDNYGPITIPKAGVTVTLSPQNIALYRRLIINYEGNKMEEKNGKIYINDKEATSYTFHMNYYWMMGDNRHNSADSRYWGFVPEDHVVGRASFVWFSNNKSLFDIRWKRLFRSIHMLER